MVCANVNGSFKAGDQFLWEKKNKIPSYGRYQKKDQNWMRKQHLN